MKKDEGVVSGVHTDTQVQLSWYPCRNLHRLKCSNHKGDVVSNFCQFHNKYSNLIRQEPSRWRLRRWGVIYINVEEGGGSLHLYKYWRKDRISGVIVSLTDSYLVRLKVYLLRFLGWPQELLGTAEMPRTIPLTSKPLSNDEKMFYLHAQQSHAIDNS